MSAILTFWMNFICHISSISSHCCLYFSKIQCLVHIFVGSDLFLRSCSFILLVESLPRVNILPVVARRPLEEVKLPTTWRSSSCIESIARTIQPIAFWCSEMSWRMCTMFSLMKLSSIFVIWVAWRKSETKMSLTLIDKNFSHALT